MSGKPGPFRAVALVGPRAAGKSTVLPLLAELLSWQGVDTDALIGLQAGSSAGLHLARVGEAAFRRCEEQVAAPVLRQADRMVIALGGGAVLSSLLRGLLCGPGLLTVFLRADPLLLAARMAAQPVLRPPLTALPAAAEVAVLLQQRLPLYRQVADLELDSGALAPAACARQIAMVIDRR